MSSLIVEISRIKAVLPHDNADRLEIAMIKDWSVVVGKGQFQIGNLVVYVPVDSVLTQNFIERHNLKIGENYIKPRIRAAKIRGVVSYGMVLPTSILPGYGFKQNEICEYTDVAEKLCITKYEEPDQFTPHRSADEKIDNLWRYLKWKVSNLFSRRKANEHFRKYTDIENFRHFPTIFAEGEDVVITEKIHGTNARYGWMKKEVNVPILKHFYRGYEFCIGSHNVQKGNSANWVYNKVADKYRLKEKLEAWKGYIFFGEIFGKKMQDLEYGLDNEDTCHEELKKDLEYGLVEKTDGIRLRIFDIMKPDGKYANYDEALITIKQIFNHTAIYVPVVYRGPWKEELKELRAGKSMICPSQMREGVVVKPTNEQWNHKLGRKILKLISEDYLLRKGATEFK